MSQQHAIVADVVEPGRGVGYVSEGPGFRFSRDGRAWSIYGGDSDEHRAEGSTLEVAIRRFAKALGVTGTAELCWEYRSKTEVIDL